MSAFRRALILVLICLASLAVAQKLTMRSEKAAAQMLGPRWKQISRGSGMIFSGSVLRIETRPTGNQAIPVVEIKLRVEHAIAGVLPAQVITIREWAGAWSQRPMSVGQRVLLFLYPPGRLGLTSPVGGALGQIALEGEKFEIPPGVVAANENSPERRSSPTFTPRVALSIDQLERAIHSARGTQPAHSRRDVAAAREE